MILVSFVVIDQKTKLRQTINVFTATVMILVKYC